MFKLLFLLTLGLSKINKNIKLPNQTNKYQNGLVFIVLFQIKVHFFKMFQRPVLIGK